MAAPVPISRTSTASFVTGGASKSISSISWQIGDVLVYGAICEGAVVLAAPTNTGTGLTWTVQQNPSSGSICRVLLATAVASTNDSGVVSGANDTVGPHWGFTVWVYRGSAGVGNSASLPAGAPPQTAKTVSLTPIGAHSAIVWLSADFNADGAPTGTPSPTTTVQSFDDGTSYSGGQWDLTDQASAGAVSYGMTTAGTAGPYSLAVVEIMAGTSVTAALTGTALAGITEADIVGGGKTIIITLTGDTFIPS